MIAVWIAVILAVIISGGYLLLGAKIHTDPRERNARRINKRNGR